MIVIAPATLIENVLGRLVMWISPQIILGLGGFMRDFYAGGDASDLYWWAGASVRSQPTSRFRLDRPGLIFSFFDAIFSAGRVWLRSRAN